MDLLMRDKWQSNRMFKSYDGIPKQCRTAWDGLAVQYWRIMLLGLYQ